MNIDLAIIVGYLLLMLVIGILKGRNVTTMRNYAVANQNYSPFVLMATMFATIIGGASTLGTAEEIFLSGVAFALACFAGPGDQLITATFVAPHMREFSGMITVGDIIGHCYGKPTKILAGIIGTLLCVGIVGAQVGAIAVLFRYFLDLHPTLSVIASSFIVILYSAFGGIRAVVATDVIQFIILIIGIPIIANIALVQIGGYEGLLAKLPATHATPFPEDSSLIKSICLCLLYAVPVTTLSPSGVQRLLLAKNIKCLRQSLYASAIVEVPFVFMISIIGLAAVILYPQVNSSDVLPQMINDILPVGLKGMAIISMLAVIMSTADSFLNTAGIMLIHDVINPLRGQHFSDAKELSITRLTTVVLGLLAVFFALNFKAILTAIIMCFDLWINTFLFPLFIGILGVRSTPRALFAGCGAGLMTFIVWTLWFEESMGFDSAVPGILANAIIFSLFHNPKAPEVQTRRLSRRFIPTLNHETPIELSWGQRWMSCLRNIRLKQWMPTLTNLNRLSAQRTELHGSPYMLFGLFALINYLVPYFMWSENNPNNTDLLLILRAISGALCIGLIAQDYWPQKAKPYLPLYWHITLLFCLPFVSTILLLDNNATVFWLMHMALAIFLLAMVVDWLSFIVLFATGVTLGFAGYKLLGHPLPTTMSMESIFLTIYMYTFSALIGLLFGYRHGQHTRSRLAHFKLFQAMQARNLQTSILALKHEVNALTNASSPSPEQLASLLATTEEIDRSCRKNVTTLEQSLSSLDKLSFDEPSATCCLNMCLQYLLSDYTFEYPYPPQKLLVKVRGHTRLAADADRLQHILYHLLNTAFYFAKDDDASSIEIEGNDNGPHYCLFIRIFGVSIDRNQLDQIFHPLESTKPASLSLGLHYCQQAIRSLHGKLTCRSAKGNGKGTTLFFISLPAAASAEETADQAALRPQETASVPV